jgi:hypothetical protein
MQPIRKLDSTHYIVYSFKSNSFSLIIDACAHPRVKNVVAGHKIIKINKDQVVFSIIPLAVVGENKCLHPLKIHINLGSLIWLVQHLLLLINSFSHLINLFLL